jgi:hypothetical protein
MKMPKLGDSALEKLHTIRGSDFCAHMQFKFWEGNGNFSSGYLAFTGSGTSRVLLVTDHGNDAVHVVDVVNRVHVGYLAAPGTIDGPRGVAAKDSLVAISAWKKWSEGEHAVRLFQGRGAMWTPLCVIGGGSGSPGGADGQLTCPRGLRFTDDGTGLAVADTGNCRVSVFRVKDGSCAQQVATVRRPSDVEEYQGGWLVACNSTTIHHVGNGLKETNGKGKRVLCIPTTMALVPGLGLVVRDFLRIHVFSTADAIAMAAMMAAMSSNRVGWIVAVVRGIAARRLQGTTDAHSHSKKIRRNEV